MTEEEMKQMLQLKSLSDDCKSLFEDDRFKRVILTHYIDMQALSIGRNYTGSEDEVNTLKAIAHLKKHLEYLRSVGNEIDKQLRDSETDSETGDK